MCVCVRVCVMNVMTAQVDILKSAIVISYEGKDSKMSAQVQEGLCLCEEGLSLKDTVLRLQGGENS